MKILLMAASFSSSISGIQRHAINVAQCLLDHPDNPTIDMLISPWQLNIFRSSGINANPRLNIHTADMSISSFSRNRWFYTKLPVLARQLGSDIVHLAYPVPLRNGAFPCPTAVTLHDLYPYDIPANFGFPKVLFNRLILQQCLRSVDSIACVSGFTRDRLGKYLPRSVQRKAICIHNCVEANVPTTHQHQIGYACRWKSGSFFLCVAQHRKNKNLPFLLNVFHRVLRNKSIDPATHLVVVGISGPETSLIRRTIGQLGLAANVTLAEGLSDSDLQWCYRNAKALLAPSTIEGFGLPVAEALLVGCPVVCSDIPSFRELGGTSCRYVPLNDRGESAFADAVVAVLRETNRKPLAMPLLSRSVIAQQYMDLYRQMQTFECRAEEPITIVG
jgi:glycosyltransferase involved in cell wall biosynthesis